jgi:hypothetical protein
MMARPARVRMRMRKPWVLARLRVFGWNVRFTTVAPNPVGVEGRQERGARAHRRFDGTGLPMVRQRGQSAGATVPHQPLRGFVRRCYSPAPPSLTARLLGPASPSRQLPRSVVRRLSRYSLAVGRRSTGSASPHLWMEMWICRSAVVLRQRQPRAEMLPERGVGGGRRAPPRRCDDLGGLPRLP